MVSPENCGRVQVDNASFMSYPFINKYPACQKVQLKALPSPGYHFVRWDDLAMDASENTKDEVTVTILSARQVTAVFALTAYRLRVISDPADGGSVNKIPSEPAGGYSPGTQVRITASANKGYSFGGWKGDATGTRTTSVVVMDADKDISATFAPTNSRSAKWWLQRGGMGAGALAVLGLAAFIVGRRLRRRTGRSRTG